MTPELKRAPVDPLATAGFERALELAATHADEVDRGARFPCETIEALREAGALSWFVPCEFDGGGVPLREIARAVFELSKRCSSAGMIFAMHQIQIACIVRHVAHQSMTSVWFANYLRSVAREQRLIASATSEAGVGGDIRRSIAALHPAGGIPGAVAFEKEASTVSYGAFADDLLTTVRRNADAEPGDQVLVLTHRSEMSMEQTDDWDTLGMRGTCSPGFRLQASCWPDQVLPVPFATIAAETMVPVSHLLWAHVWLGLSANAFDRAQNFVQAQARLNCGTTPPAARRLAELSAHMATFRASVDTALEEYTAAIESGGPSQISTLGYAVRINQLKIVASEAALEACQGALRVCGFAGYKNETPFSVGRALRDAYSAALMVSNERLYATNAALLLVHRENRRENRRENSPVGA